MALRFSTYEGKKHMAVDADIVVKIDGGEVVFPAPGLNDWAFFGSFAEKNTLEIAEMVVPKIKAIRGIKNQDGSDVTLEQFQRMEISLPFFNRLIALWIKTIQGASSPTEAEAKNALTPTL